MPTVGPLELAIALVFALLILGPKRLPGAGRALGSGLREFKDGIAGARGHDTRCSACEGTRVAVIAGVPQRHADRDSIRRHHDRFVYRRNQPACHSTHN
jgi:TatA/E family protein of Tat protein translocase